MATLPAIQMTWQSWVSADDVATGFQQLATVIDEQPQPFYVLLNMQGNVRFPLRDTAQIILDNYDVTKNEAIAGWILIGGREHTQPLAAMLNNLLESAPIHRVDTPQQAHAIINPSGAATTAAN